MCATVNEPGKEYNWMALGREGNAFTPFGPAASLALARIWKALARRIEAEKQGKSFPFASKMFLGCVRKLETAAYHLSRLHSYRAELLERIRRGTEDGVLGTAGFLEPEPIFEFEALVLQSRAALDTATWFLSHRCGQEAWTFKSLRNILANRAASDKRIRRCLALLDGCPWISDSRVLVVGAQSTRSYIAHYGSLLGSQRTCFTATRIDPESVLIFDAEVHDNVPVMTTASKIQEEVLYFVTAALSVFLDLPLPKKKAFANDLGGEFAVLSESVSPAGDGMKIGVVKEMWSGGFVVADVTISKGALARAVNLRDLTTT